jgi:hypothetical protein
MKKGKKIEPSENIIWSWKDNSSGLNAKPTRELPTMTRLTNSTSDGVLIRAEPGA